MNVIGKGSVKILLTGINHVIVEVYYVPDLRNNLLSIGQLQERGFGTCKIFHPLRGLIIQTTMSINRMFILLHDSQSFSQEQANQCFLTGTQNLCHLWHRRYGHLSYKGLRTLSYRNMVCGLPPLSTSNAICTDCLKGKKHRDPIPKKSTWRASQKLELIHADICGPITPTSNNNKRYILLFTDDYSRKTWVYFLVEKLKAFSSFKSFKSMAEKQKCLFVKCLRTDRGGEFISNEFNDFCKHNGIKRQMTTAYTPQQNDITKRKNRTVMNMVRSMLSDKNIPKTFWAEAVNWVVYVLNRCPTLAVKDVTLEEA